MAEESLAVHQRLGDRLGTGRAEWAIASTYYFESDLVAAREHMEAALSIFEEVGDRFMTGWTLYMRGLISLRDDLAAARTDLTEAYKIFRSTDDVTGYALVFDAFGAIAHLAGDDVAAARLAGLATATEHLAGSGLGAANRDLAKFDPERLRAESPEFAVGFALGQRMELGGRRAARPSGGEAGAAGLGRRGEVAAGEDDEGPDDGHHGGDAQDGEVHRIELPGHDLTGVEVVEQGVFLRPVEVGQEGTQDLEEVVQSQVGQAQTDRRGPGGRRSRWRPTRTSRTPPTGRMPTTHTRGRSPRRSRRRPRARTC